MLFRSTNRGVNLMPLLRHGADPADLTTRIATVWSGRADRYSEQRGQRGAAQRKVEMYRLGG